MIHYHGTPITPRETLYELAGRHFCVSFAEPRDVKVCHEIGQSVMLDNGAFSIWRDPNRPPVDWDAFVFIWLAWTAIKFPGATHSGLFTGNFVGKLEMIAVGVALTAGRRFILPVASPA